MKKKKIISALTSAVLMMTASVTSLTSVNSADDGVMRDITTMELVRDMGVGINLGNTMESCGDWIAQWGAEGYAAGTVESYETAWGSPIITQDMIEGYASEGFGVVRVPVAWSNMIGDNYQINADYMARVKEIVDWVIDADMYAIINIHYDSGWLHNLPTDPDGCKNRFKVMWEQIADYFKDYSDYLMFESQNEELGWDSIWNQWSGTAEQKAQSYAYVNEVNQLFVDTVRASGGNNDERHLLISGYKTDITLTCDSLFEMPDDPANRCAVSVHYYTPAGFAILETDADWAECRETWGTEADFAELESNMELMKTTYIDKGIPVIIGEYGCPKDLKDSDGNVTGQKDPDSVRLFLSSVCEEAYERQLCPVLWDITDLHYDRTNCQLFDQELKTLFNEISGFGSEEPTTEPTTEPTVTTTTTAIQTITTTTIETTITETTTTTSVATIPITTSIICIEPLGVLSIDSLPDKLEYTAGTVEELNLSGLTVSLDYYTGLDGHDVIYDNVNPNDPEFLDVFIVDTSEFDISTPGTYTITVKCTDDISGTYWVIDGVSFEVTVVNPNAVKGDVNADGETTVTDIVLLNKYLLGKETLSETMFTCADMNNDGKINIFDGVILKRLLISIN